MEALVTGAYGFIGRHVARGLAARGYRVVGMGHGAWDRSEWQAWGIGEWHLSDITLETLGEYGGDPEVLVHCAGSGSVSYSVKHPFQDYRRTVDTTLAVLEYIRTSAPNSRLAIPSSAAVYGLADRLPIPVDAGLNPVSPYGVHKKIVEELCHSYSRHFGVRAVAVRLFSIYGLGLRKQILWDACTKIQSGNFAFMGSGNETRDLLHVEDAVELLLTAAEGAPHGFSVVNGGSGDAVPISTLLCALMAALGVDQELVFSGIVRAGDPLHYEADISESLRLGWKPRRDWRSEISAYAEWFKSGAP